MEAPLGTEVGQGIADLHADAAETLEACLTDLREQE